MKSCPKCQQTFPDGLNFCLNDGSVLRDSLDDDDPARTLPLSRDPTWSLPAPPQTSDDNEILTRVRSGRQPATRPGINLLPVFIVFFGFGLLIALGIVTYLRFASTETVNYPPPTRTPVKTQTPVQTPKTEDNIKVEILDKMSDGFGHKYLKCKVTNTGEKIVHVSSVSLNFYQGDIKIKEASASPELGTLKPNQTIPVWISLYDAEKYTSVKVKEPLYVRPADKPAAEVYPPLEISQTEMKAEPGYMMVNFRQYRKIFYKVSGIVENPLEEKVSVNLYVVFYDANSEIIGIGKTYLSNLARGEKTRFEVQEVETDMFGKPTRFEIIAISN